MNDRVRAMLLAASISLVVAPSAAATPDAPHVQIGRVGRVAKLLRIARPAASPAQVSRAAHATEPPKDVSALAIKPHAEGATFSRPAPLRVGTKLAPHAVWNELMQGFTDSTRAPLWARELETTRMVSGAPRLGGEFTTQMGKAKPLAFRITKFDEREHAFDYMALEGSAMAGGGKVRVLPDGRGGSVLQWEEEYSGSKTSGFLLKALFPYLKMRMSSNLRRIERSSERLKESGGS